MKSSARSILSLLVVFAILVAQSDGVKASTASSAAAIRTPLLSWSSPKGSSEPSDQTIQIDFDRALAVPADLRQPIADAMMISWDLLPAKSHFTVTALRVTEDWMHAVVVPTDIVDAGWEIAFGDDEIVEVLGRRAPDLTWEAHIRGSSGYLDLMIDVPVAFIDSSTVEEPDTPTDESYLFPWTSGQYWYKTQGWHSGNSIDFQPVVRTTPAVHFAVLASASGRLTETCNDGHQSILQITHSDGTTRSLHLDAGSIRRDLLGQNIQRGQFVGVLYNGREGERDYNGVHYQYWTTCGYGTAVHLHFTLPRQDMTVDGHNANNVAGSAFATQYRSSNQRVDGGGSSQNCADGEGVVLYEHGNYSGRCSRFTGDDGNVGDNTIGNDAASSIRIIGNFEATVYENGNYEGARSTYTADDPDFGNDDIRHDRASSIRVRRRDAGGNSNCDGGHGVYLYEHGNYGGRCSKYTSDSPNPRSWYVGNDAASSIRIVGDYEATVFENDDYQGASSTFVSDDSDFGNDSIRHDRASSIRVRQRQTGNSNCDGGAGVYLYEHGSYTGRCSKFTSDSPNPRSWYIGNDTASSIRFVGNYEATIYQHDDYQGTGTAFAGDDPDFGNDAIGHDQASSIRVRTQSTGPTSCQDGQFLAEYFSNRHLSGSPVFRRCESAVGYDWGSGGPGNGVGNDEFSVRWSGRFWLSNDGTYRFTTRTDDGVRLWLDGQLLIDHWQDMAATRYTVDRNLNSGLYTVRMEYFERGGAAVAELSWNRTGNAGGDTDDGRTITYGDALDGTIDPSGDRDDYYFQGSAGQAITIRLDKRNSNLDTFVELYNPDGSLLGQDDDSGDGTNSHLSISLRQNGRHKIIARAYGSGTGGYRLSLSQESTADPDDNRWISLGGTLQGTISPNNDRDWYYFSGVTGRIVSIRMNKIDSGLDGYLELYNEAGVKVAENDDGGGDRNSWLVYTIPAGGTYRIMARSYNLASSGRYNLSLSSVNNNNLARGKPAYASSVEANGLEAYRAFDGNLGTRWSSRFNDPQLIQVDLGSPTLFSQVVLRWETAYARRYGIYYSNGNTWTPLYWTDSGNGGNDTIQFAPVRARYVAMYGVARGTGWGYSLWEFEVYDSTTVPLPTVPPDPGDKPPETGVDPVTPLPPNDEGKPTVLIGEGPTGQEDMPLPGQGEEAPTAGIQTGLPTAEILYPNPTVPEVNAPDSILFQGVAADNDEDGESIVEYRWLSSLDGQIGTTDTFWLPLAALSPGTHTITFQARDDEGDWSEPVTVRLLNGGRVYLPQIIKQR